MKKRGTYKNIDEYIESITGKTRQQILDELNDASQKLGGIQDFKDIVDLHQIIAILGDYDVDGIGATTDLYMLLKAMKKKVIFRFPKRISEGFGLSVKAVEEVAAQGATLIITVDNGITANEAVARAKELGLTVIITDHHLPNKVLPDADLIIDPKAVGNSDFDGYCGAGLVYKIIEGLVKPCAFTKNANAIAAISTIADAVPIREDNRRIVYQGLLALRKTTNAGLKALVKAMNLDLEHIGTEEIAFKIAPALNAPGRLLDDGAKISMELLMSTATTAPALAEKIVELNNQRKKLVADAEAKVNEMIAQEGLKCPLIVNETIHEGVVGIVAGNLAERYGVPTIVVTRTEKGFKGSSRAPEGYHMKEMLDDYADMLVNYGGHAAAAGLTIKEECYEDFVASIQEKYKDYTVAESEVSYDLEISEEDMTAVAEELDTLAPFGEGFPVPTFLVRCMTLVPDKDGLLAKPIGEDKMSLRFNGVNKMNGLALGMANRYNEIGTPARISCVGKVGFNHWNGWKFTQIRIHYFEKAPDSYMSLAAMVKQRLAELRSSTYNPVDESEMAMADAGE